MINCKVSIIIPVYNAEKYLRQCLDSVINQTYENLEIIIVNDGSTDSSTSICEEYTRKDKRVYVYHKSNTGVSDSRNIGIQISSGEYLMFMDADDYWLDYRIIERFVSIAINQGLDLLKGNYMEFSETSQINVEDIPISQTLRDITCDSSEFLIKSLHGNYFIWQCLFKRDFIRDFQFDTKRVFLEDARFYLSILCKSGRFATIDYCFYAYRKHSDAVSVKNVPQKMKDAFDFSRFCFCQADIVEGQLNYQRFCAEEGIKNYLFDISVISYKKWQRNAMNEFNCKYALSELRRLVIKKVVEFRLYKYVKVLLPLFILHRYYYVRHKLRILLKGA